MPSGLSESPDGWGSTAGGFGGGGGTSFGSYTEDNGVGGYNTINVSDYGLDPNDSGGWNNPNYSGPDSPFSDSSYSFSGDSFSPSYSAFSNDIFSPAADFASSSPPAFDGSIGNLDMQRYSLDALDAQDQYGAGEDGFWGSPLGKNLKKFGMFALSVNPSTRVPMALYNMYNAYQAGNYGGVAGGLVGAVTQNPVAGTLVGMGANALSGKPMNAQDTGKLGASMGAMFGGEIAGPIGGFLGQQLGQTAGVNLGNRVGLGGPNGAAVSGDASRGGTSMSGTDATLASLLALYGYNQSNKANKGNDAAVQAQIAAQQEAMRQFMEQSKTIEPEMREPDFGSVYAKMDEMYNPNGVYAQNLRTTLERKDAAAGRRSQYGPREVNLLAALAQARAQSEPGYLNAAAAEANAFNSMAVNDANSRRAALQAALQGQNNVSSSQLNAIQAANQSKAAKQQQQMQTLGALYSIGRDQGWWNNLFSGE